ncbi:hypothetical protein BK816_03460 [Boudabousia tangfeifanii]|uniref:GerMN domain-containing protein n=1 Tax=Boudabousia tangfeifanii TaxID=1912795 RepID=A0A1D9MJI6_9ACTO|nr:LpqB family beta-propeller domain-containing protein [Boudabousia tangfeifanii]AOZ72467.1 hypothetical protein BK816_03460 [Boudabousia tangfeifanii]
MKTNAYSSYHFSTKLLSIFVVFAVAILGGCASLPHQGEVKVSRVIVPNEGFSTQKAPKPLASATKNEILSGFLAACRAGAINNDFEAAGQYLLEKTAKAWNPQKVVHLYPNDVVPQVKSSSDNQLVLELSSSGTVDDRGELQSSPNLQLAATFTFAQNNEGEWRIASLPDGITISEGAFHDAYVLRNLYFLSPDKQELVPDPRWVPRFRIVTYLTSYLLEGPSKTLDGAVTTAIPAGASLLSRNVPVENGVAQVRLEAADPVTSSRGQSLLSWQIQSTLQQVPSVTGVELTLNEQTINAQPPRGLTYNAPVGVVVKGNQVVRVDGQKVYLSADKTAGINLRHPARGPLPNSPMVVLDANRRILSIDLQNGNLQELVASNNIAPPVVDRWGWIWYSTPDLTNSLKVVNTGQERYEVTKTYASGNLTRFAISRDGARMWAMRAGDKPSLDLLRIVRNEEGVPKSLELISQMALDPGSLAFPAWQTSTSAVVLVTSPGRAQSRLVSLKLGERPTEVANAPLGTDFAAGFGTEEMLLQTPSSEVFSRDGRRWSIKFRKALDPTFF